MTDISEGEDLLYNLAYECEALFDHLQDTLRKRKCSDAIAEVCGEFQQRFAIWAAHLGVFARKSQCLDTRLQNLPDLQDLVARLLDILRRSLQQCTVELPSQGVNDGMMTDIHEIPSGAPQEQTAALQTIDDTLTRLNRLGVTIRQSGRGKLDTRVKRFAAGLDLSSFACLCAEAIQALYPGAHQSLKGRLSKSMTDRYARMLFLDSRHQKLQTRRELPLGLPPIHEVPTSEVQTNTPFLQVNMAIKNKAVHKLLRPPPAFSQSDLSSVNLQQIRSRLRPPDEASTKFHKTSSVQVNQGNYPHIPTATDGSSVFTCPWCSELLSKKTLSDSEWRRHIDRDLKPYICLSEACPEAHPAYATFDEWYRHMELHDRRWHQHTYLTSSWVCTICELNPDTYSSPQALYLHLEESHGTEFSHPQLQAISRQSKTEQPRAANDCLLCCFAVEEQGSIGEAVFPKRRKGQMKQQASKSARKTLEMAHPGPHDSDSDLSDTSSDSDDMGSVHGRQRSQSGSRAVSRHVAVHLQVLMLLTLRFAAALQDHDGDVDDGTKSNSVDIDEGNSASDVTDLGRLSHVASEDDVTMKDRSDEGNGGGDMDLDESPSDDITADDIPVPDSDIDLQFIPRQYDNLAVEDDEFLNELIESGDFLSWEDIPKGFSIARGVMTAARVALMSVPTIVHGVSFNFADDGDGDDDNNPLPSHSENMNETSSDPIATEQLPDESDEPIRPDTDVPGAKHQGAHSTAMGKRPDDRGEEDVEGDRVVRGMTIYDHVVGVGGAVRNGDTVSVNCVLKSNASDGFDGDWRSTTPSQITVGKSSDQVVGRWDLGIIGMSIGGERRVTIPIHLVFGSQNLPDTPADSQLIFDIRLIEILDESMNEDAEFKPKAGQDGPLKGSVESETDHLRPEPLSEKSGVGKLESPSPGPDTAISKDEDKEANLEKVDNFLSARQSSQVRLPVLTEQWTQGPSQKASVVGKMEWPPSEPDMATSEEDRISLPKELEHSDSTVGTETASRSKGLKVQDPGPIDTSKHHLPVPAATDMSQSSNSYERSDPYEGLMPAAEISVTPRLGPTRPTRPALRLKVDQQVKDSGSIGSFNSMREAGSEDEADRDTWLPLSKARGRRAEESPPSLVSGEDTYQMDVSREANREPGSSTRPRYDAGAPRYMFADTEEDSRPRLKRVGHVQFDEFPELRAPFPSFSDHAVSEGAEEAGHPSMPSPDNATARFEIGTPPRESAESGFPFHNQIGVEEGPAVPETEKHMCTIPGCGKTVKDLEAHMLTHPEARPHKCPFTTCKYHTKGFAQRYDKNCHLLTHYKGTILCDFCPGSGSAAAKSFKHLDDFKEHLSAVHGVERTSPIGRRRARRYGQKTLAYAPDATGTCSICGEFFTDAQEFYEHLGDCVLRIVQRVNLPKSDESSDGRPRRLDTVHGQQGNLSDITNELVDAQALCEFDSVNQEARPLAVEAVGKLRRPRSLPIIHVEEGKESPSPLMPPRPSRPLRPPSSVPIAIARASVEERNIRRSRMQRAPNWSDSELEDSESER